MSPSDTGQMKATWAPRGPSRGGWCRSLHGIMSSAAPWWRIGPALAARGWHVEAFELPAHGDSPRLGRPLSLETQAAGVAARLGGPVGVPAGHSLGAIAALAAAGRWPGP